MNKTLSYNFTQDHKDFLNSNNFKFYSTNPSNQHRLRNYGFPEQLAPFYNQNILKDNPSNAIFYSGISGISSDSTIELPNTGEYFKFSDSELNVYKNVVDDTYTNTDDHHVNNSTNNLKKSIKKDNKVSDNNDYELFNSIKTKLNGLKLREHPCELCAKTGYKSLFNDQNDLSEKDPQFKFTEPCSHSSLKNVPVVYPITKFDKNLSYDNKDDRTNAYGLSNVCNLTKLDSKDQLQSNDTLKKENLNLDEVNVDHLLTYNHNKFKTNEPTPKQDFDISEFLENKKYLNDLSPIKTKTLREVALNSKFLNEDESNFVNQDSQNNQVTTDLPTISLNEVEVDRSKLERWVYPNCLRRQKSEFGTVELDKKKGQLSESNKEDDETFKEIQEYLRNREMSVDFMMEKYINLRKANCSKEALKALKHLICIKLNKQKLYYKGTEIKVLNEDSQESLFDKVINNINRTDQLVQNDLVKEDDSTLYTYSSLSLSTYDSILENMTFGVSDNNFFYEDPDSIHLNTLDAYGWLSVLDENVRSQQYKILYCELIGNKFSLHTANYKANYKSVNSNKSVKTIVLDEFFTMIRKKDSKRNKIYIRLHGTELKSNETVSDSKKHNTAKNDETSFLRLEADTQNELLNWFTFLGSRSKIRSFFTVLDDHRVTPLNNSIYFLLYPKRKELIFNRLSYNHDCEEEIYKMFIKHPFHYLDFSMRNLTDMDLVHHMSKWVQPVFTVNFSHNKLNLCFDPELLVDYANNNSIQKLFLDKNPIDERSYLEVLPELVLKTGLKFISFRGCVLYDSLTTPLKKINKSKDIGKVVIDFRQCELSNELEMFLIEYPFNNVQVILQNAPTVVQEFEMDYFMDTKNLSEISILGSLISGRLLSTQWRVRKKFNWPFSKNKNDDAVDVYFEFKAPYLVWHDWFPRNKRFIFNKKSEDKEDNSKLTESQAVFVKDTRLLSKEGENWLIIHGLIPQKFKSQNKDTKIVVKAYTDKATKRWFEILNRWIAGITYVEYIMNHPTTLACRHILSFCSRIDTPELVMNGFPCEKKLLMRFLSYLSGQTSLKSLNFSNMGLDINKLSFERMVLKDLTLHRMDWSFNLIEMRTEDLWVLNALLPKITTTHYNISHNPLGDTTNSSKFFFRVLSLEPQKISFNHCKLGTTFITKLTSALTKFEGKFESVQIIELEGNEFDYEDIKSFVDILVEKFPNLIDLRLEGSIDQENAKELVDFNPICNFERISKDEPEVGDFTRVIHVKKEKNTTRQSFLQNKINSSTQF